MEIRLADWAFNHRRSLLFFLVLLVAAGTATLFQLPVSLFPQVSFPRIRVNLDAGDRPAERMSVEITTPVEEALRAIPNVHSLRSTTSRGSAEISVNFEWGDDMNLARLQVQTAISQLLPSLPTGVAFSVDRMDPTVFPVTCYSMTSANHSLVQLRDLALFKIRPELMTTPGVARIEIQGGETEEYHVDADPEKLQSLGLTVSDVSAALSANNILVASGRLEENHRLYLVVSDTRFHNIGEIKKTVLRSTPSGVVLLENVASVERSTQPQWIRVRADGRDAVLLQVFQQPGSNTELISSQIKERLDKMASQLPSGVSLANWYDQSQLIKASISSVQEAVFIGVLLAVLTLLVFLRNWRVTLIAAITVPAVLTSALLMLFLFKMSLDIMTLGGMAAAVGLIIDDAIVMVEHIVRRVRAAKKGSAFALNVRQAADEFTRPLAASSAATIIIFAPLSFLSGVTGAFFKSLSLTMACCLIISFCVSLFVVPILTAALLSEKDADIEDQGKFALWCEKNYRALMTNVLSRSWLGITATLLIFFLGYVGMSHVSSGFMPAMDEGGFTLDYKSAPGTSLAETDRMLQKVDQILQSTPDVQTYSRRTGLQFGGGITESNTGDIFIRLKPRPRRDIEDVMADIRSRIEMTTPGLKVETAQLMEDLIGDLTSIPQPIEVKLYSDDAAALQKLSPKVAEAISTIRGIVEVNSGITPAGDAIVVQVDRVKASLEGVDPEFTTQVLSDLLQGKITSSVQKGPKLVSIRVGVPSSYRKSSSDLENLLLRAPDGHLFPLKRIASLSVVSGQPEITREDLKRMVAVTARISGRDLGSVLKDVERVMNQPGIMPVGITYALGGLYDQQKQAFRGLSIVLAMAAALVFLLLLFLYESFRVAGAMLCVALLAVAGVYFGLWITGTEVNIASRMGMTMVVGIVTEVSIFYYSEYLSLPGSSDRFVMAGVNRIRPIAMTSFAAAFALTPLSLGLGDGSAMLHPLAVAITSGLLFQTPLVLILLPTLLALLRVKPTTPPSVI